MRELAGQEQVRFKADFTRVTDDFSVLEQQAQLIPSDARAVFGLDQLANGGDFVRETGPDLLR